MDWVASKDASWRMVVICAESVLLRDGYISSSDNTETKKHLNIIMKDMACVKYKDFLFDFSALDVDRLKGMFGL